MTPPSSSGTRKSERLGKQTANSVTPPPRKSERIEKKNPSPLRRSERTKMPSLSASSGSKRSNNSPDPLKTKREKSVKQATIYVEDEDSDEKPKKKKRHARTYKALFQKKQHKEIDETEESTETTHEGTSQSAEEAHKNNNKHKLKNRSLDGGDPQISKDGSVSGEMNDESTSTSQRNRKRVQNFDDLQKETGDESAQVAKRQKKSVGDAADHSSPKAVLQEGKLAAAGDREGTSEASGSDTNNISKIPALNMDEWERRRKQRDSQKNLHVLLRPKIAKLCEILHLTEDVKAMVERFLEYVMNNHLVNREPETIFQAFQISLCWCAASFLKQKLDHKESLALAKQHIGFTCKKEEADYVYSMLRCLKRMFLYRTGYLKVPNSPEGCGLSPEIQLAKSDLQRSIKEIEKKFNKLMGKLIEKYEEEKEQVNQKYEKEKAELENMKRTEEAVIRLHGNVSMRTDKLKSLDTEYARKFNELKQQKDLNLKNLEPSQVAAISNIQERKARWVESVKSWVQVELVKPPVSHQISDGSKVKMSDQETVSPTEALENFVSMRPPSWEEIPNRASLSKPNREATLKAAESVGFHERRKNLSLLQEPSSEKISDIHTFRKVDGQVPLRETVVANSGEGQENLVSVEALSSEEIPVAVAVSNIDSEVHLRAPETASSGDGHENLPPLVVTSSEVVPGGTTLNMADGEIPLGRTQAICSTEGQGNILSTNCSFEKQIPSGATLNVPDEEIPKSTSEIATSCEEIPVGAAVSNIDSEVHLRAPETASSGDGHENLPPLVVTSSDVVPGRTTLNISDGEIPLGRNQAICSTEGQGNISSTNCSFEKQIPTGATLNVPDEEIPKSTSEIATSCEDIIVCTNPSTSKESETAPSEILDGGRVQRANDRTSPMGNDQQDGVLSTMNIKSVSKEPSLADLSSGQPNVPDEEIPKSTSEIASSCEDIIVCTNPSTSKEAETAPSEILNGGRIQRANDRTSPMENYWQDGVLCTMNIKPVSQEPSLADLSSGQPVHTLDQAGPLPPDWVSPNVDSLPYASSGVQARYNANNEMPNVSQAAETSPFNGTIGVTFNVSNPGATVVELREQMQQLRCPESTSNLSPPDQPFVSAIEHQLNNEGQTANQSSQALGQSVTNHIELSDQDVLRPLHSPIDVAVNGLVRQTSEMRTASVPSVSNGLPLRTAPTVSSQMPLTLFHDPLQNEMDRISKAREQTSKVHEDAKLQLKFECEKEIEEVVLQIRRKYQVKLKEKEAEFLPQKKELDVIYNKVHMNKILAEAFRCKCMDSKVSGSAGAQQEANSSFMQQLFQLSSQQFVQQFPTASGLPSTGSASSMQTASHAVVNAQTMTPSLQPSTASGIPSINSDTSMQAVPPAISNAQTMGPPPLQGVNPSARFSSTPTRPPHISTISSATGNLQIGTEIRAPAPHLQPFRPTSSFSPSNLPLHSHGMSSQQAHNNHPGSSTSLHQSYVNPLAHRQASARGQPGRIQHEIAGGLKAPPSLELTMGLNDPSGANVNPPGFLASCVSSRLGMFSHRESHVPSSQSNSNSAQQSGGATDIVCLSDDD